MKHSLLDMVKNCGMILVGSAVYALAFNAFYVPNGVAFGGVTGLAQILHFFVPALPVGTLVILFNIPLFLLGGKLLGRRMLAYSLFAMTVSSLFLDALALLVEFPPMKDALLATVAGGVLLGVGLGIIFLRGATTGGTEIVARLLKLKLTWLPMGKLLLVTDLVVIALVALVFRQIETALYGVVALYLSTFIMDQVLYGLDSAKVAYIISERPEEIVRALVRDLDRGVTVLHGEGGYSGESKRVLMCAFKQRQIVAIKEVVRQADPHAFMIVTATHEILGEGFRGYNSEL